MTGWEEGTAREAGGSRASDGSVSLPNSLESSPKSPLLSAPHQLSGNSSSRLSQVPNTGPANTNNILTHLLTHTSGQPKYVPSSASAHIDERILEDTLQTGIEPIILLDCTGR